MHREEPHKLLQVGVTPTPATNFEGEDGGWKIDDGRECVPSSILHSPSSQLLKREVIRLPACKSGVAKQNRKRRAGALPALPTNLTRNAECGTRIGQTKSFRVSRSEFRLQVLP